MPKIKQVYLYEDRNLPKCGWFQGCIICGTITSKNILYDFKAEEPSNVKYEFHTFLCPICQRLIKNDENKLQEYKMITNEMIHQEFGLE